MTLRNHLIVGGQLVPITKSAATDYKELHEVADRFVTPVKVAFLAAVARVKDSVTLKKLTEAVKGGRSAVAAQLLELDKEMSLALKSGQLTSALRTTYQQAAEVSWAQLAEGRPKVAQLIPRFDLLNPRAVEFLRAYDFSLIKELTDTTRRAIGDVVDNAFRTGKHPYEQARYIKELVGLTQNQAKAVDNYRSALEEAGNSPEQVRKLTEKYSKKVLAHRAETIARTETIRASSEGQRELWRQAQDVSLLPPTALRKWVLTPDDRLCDTCRAIPKMNPDGVPLTGQFQTPVGPVTTAPAHPNCRCTTSLIITEEMF